MRYYERNAVVHAHRRSAHFTEDIRAHGTVCDISRYTKAKICAEVGKQAPMFTHFSTVADERGVGSSP